MTYRGCRWCGRPFVPRPDGGRAQRFCSLTCRRAFDAAARRWAADAIDAGMLAPEDLRWGTGTPVHAAQAPGWACASGRAPTRALDAPPTGDLFQWFGDLTGKVPCDEVFRALGIDRPHGSHGIGEAMGALGWHRAKRRCEGELRWCYVRGASEAERRRSLFVIRDPITGSVIVAAVPEAGLSRNEYLAWLDKLADRA